MRSGEVMKKIFLGTILISLIFLTTGCKKDIIGKWKSVDEENEYYYIFNDDKTCSYEMTVARLDCTYEKDDETLTVLYKGTEEPKTYKYRFEDNNLIITDNNGKDYNFVKEK